MHSSKNTNNLNKIKRNMIKIIFLKEVDDDNLEEHKKFINLNKNNLLKINLNLKE